MVPMINGTTPVRHELPSSINYRTKVNTIIEPNLLNKYPRPQYDPFRSQNMHVTNQRSRLIDCFYN